jgi:hypothetical protein
MLFDFPTVKMMDGRSDMMPKPTETSWPVFQKGKANTFLAHSREHHGLRRACPKVPSIAGTQGCSALLKGGA